MMNQGLGPLTPEDKTPIKVKDVADIVAENLEWLNLLKMLSHYG